MDGKLQWITWAFAGFGVLAVTGITAFYRSRTRRQDQSPQGEPGNGQASDLGASAGGALAGLTAADIRKKEAALLPSERTAFLQSCIGVNVRWPVVFYSVRPNDDGSSVCVSGKYGHRRDNTNHSIIVLFTLPLHDYPRLKFVSAGQQLWVQGEITGAEHIIQLDNATFEFDDAE